METIALPVDMGGLIFFMCAIVVGVNLLWINFAAMFRAAVRSS